MLKKLELLNFKCFRNLKLDFGLLNVMTGINSNGKSTVIQSLLLVKQSYEIDKKFSGIYLNGKYIKLGTGKDILFNGANKDSFSIKLKFDDDKELKLTCNKRASQSDFQKISKVIEIDKSIDSQNLLSDKFSYISAERLSPQKYYEASYIETNVKRNIGVHGEYFAAYLANHLSDVVENKELLKSGEQRILSTLMQEWMGKLGFRLKISSEISHDSEIAILKYDDHTPINVGFGISYVVPVVMSLLKAKKGDLLILENPEAHIHPRGQRVLGELISLVSSGGVQVIVETHSDHLLNGIRIAVKKKIIKNEDVVLNYFYTEQEEGEHKVVCPKINKDGSLTEWPDGFFDEWEKALEEIII